MKLKSVTINGMHKIAQTTTYSFEDITYLCGANGSGKSTVLQAIQLGLLGYIPGTKKLASAILEHSNRNKIEICLDIVSSNDSDKPNEITIDRSIFKEGTRINETCKVYPEGYDIHDLVGNLELPILNFNEFLNLSANKQKELMISILPSSFNPISTKNYLTSLSQYSESCKEIVADASTQYTELKKIDDIKGINEYLKTIQSDRSAELKRVVNTVQSLVFYDDYSGESDVESLKRQIENIMIERDASLKQESIRDQYEKCKSQLDTFSNLSESIEKDVKYLNLNTILDMLKSHLSSANILLTGYNNRLSECKAKYAQNSKLVNSNGICPFTECECASIQDQIEKIEDSNKSLNLEITDLKSKINSENIVIQGINDEILHVQNQLDMLRTDYRSRDSVKSMLESISLDYQNLRDSSELSDQLKLLNDDLVKASANQRYNELIEVIQRQKFEIEEQITFLKEAVKATGENGLQSDVMVKPFIQIENAMQNILNDLNLKDLGSIKFNLESKANSFNFGFVRDKFIGFELLSSGEKCIFTLVFMCALIKISNSKLSFMLIDDLFDHLDSNRLETINFNVEKLPSEVQLIIAGVNRPDANCKCGIIDVGGNND